MSSSVFPFRTLLAMSLAIKSFPEDWYLDDEEPPSTQPQHPHPLRSNSKDNGVPQSETMRSDRPDSCVLDSTTSPYENTSPYDQRGSYFSNRSNGTTSTPTVSPLAHPAFRHASTERFGDAPLASPILHDFPIVPTRPPLRPTISFGSVSRYSYYSFASSDFDQKSKAVIAVEGVEVQSPLSQGCDSLGWKIYFAIAVLCMLSFICGMNVTLPATALPVCWLTAWTRLLSLTIPQIISHNLNLKSVEAFWVPSSFLLASTLVQPLFMRLSYALGSKLLILFGLLLFWGGSIASGLATDLAILLLGRSLQGCGSGAIIVLTQLIVCHLTGLRDPYSYQRTISAIYWLGAAVGPTIGGAAAQTVGWRYMFWVNVPLCLFGLISLPFLLDLPKPGSILQQLGRVDMVGWLLIAGSVSPLILAFSWAGSVHAWKSWQTLVPLITGIGIMAVWALYSRYRIDPIVPMSIFRRATAIVACLGAMVHGMVYTAVAYLVPLYLELAKNMSPAITGVALCAWTLPLVVAAVVSGTVVSVFGHRWTSWLGSALLTTGLGLMIILDIDTIAACYIPVGILTGTALGMLSPALIAATQASATTDDETIHAVPLHSFFNSLGQTFGVAIGSCMFLNQLHTQITTQPELTDRATLLTQDAVALIRAVQDTSATQAGLKAALQNSYSDSLRWVWIVLCILSGVTLALSLWFTEGRRRRRLSLAIAHAHELQDTSRV